MSKPNHPSKAAAALPEREILQAVREIRFGTVEVIVHEGRVMEIRQTKKVRLPSDHTGEKLSDLSPGG